MSEMFSKVVMPAKAGISGHSATRFTDETPDFAGVTAEGQL